jgi:hypothetical protein
MEENDANLPEELPMGLLCGLMLIYLLPNIQAALSGAFLKDAMIDMRRLVGIIKAEDFKEHFQPDNHTNGP